MAPEGQSMKLGVFDVVLLAVTIVGGYFAWQTGRERSRLAEKYDRLVQVTGDLPVADASKVYVRALDTGEPMHFAWRVYVPPNYQQIWKSNHGGSSTSSSSSSSEFITRVRFREGDQGRLDVYTHFSGGSSRSTLADGPFAGLLRDHWGEVRVEQLGAAGLAVLGPDQSAVILRLTLPDDLRDRAPQRFIPVLFELDLGPEPANP
jgi:hypothetical protein